MSPSDSIIVPLDVSSQAEAIALVDRLPQVGFWKVGLELFVSSGPDILVQLKRREKRIFLDLKFHDIPNTIAGACRAAARYGVDFLTIHATAGKAGLEAAVEAAQQGAQAAGCPPPRLLAVTVLTSIHSRALALELRVPLALSDYALQMALLVKESGFAGVVCSPQEAKKLRRFGGNAQDLLIVCPGVRPSWAAADDQQRVMTPAQAIADGANYLVIGRPITQAPDPVAAYEKICHEISASVL
ncbi:MAG: orotidine-5'-phosphate decarboxylase [Leptolyngbyaceae cyanobacterium T60_A2020_046]|nr:orotidine-5'-phosphate decarboxylase [Leptolyngbyaceae cyanobacterium T60_A2020_046]